MPGNPAVVEGNLKNRDNDVSHSVMPNGKASAVPPQVSADEDVELANMHDGEAKQPLLEDVMQLARLGEVGPIQKLFQQGKVGADFHDKEGITPLHWAAINNKYALCKFLIDSGADVNAKGGQAFATPTMWAVQRCHYYIVHLLLEYGADPLLTDAQGYNILHLATFDGNAFLLVLLLHQNIPIDGPDLHGHTCLMWAAFKGYVICVDLFLRWGASVNATDENGFTALHWAVNTGSQSCMQKLIEYGSDRSAETLDHKTPDIIAADTKTIDLWHRALRNCGYNDNGNPRQPNLPFGPILKQRSFLNRFFFLCPFFLLFLVIYILSGMVIYAGVPTAIFCSCLLQWAAQQLFLWAPSDIGHLHQTPYLAGVFAATCFWVGARWLFKILPNTYATNPVLNILFAISYALCSIFYTLSMIEDPGYVPKSGSRSQQKATIEELLSLWKFDDQNFCVHCMIRKPLRSKHCKRCKRCVAKHDHHCPWVYNCVGANNLRHFFLYILFMETGIITFVRLVITHLENSPSPVQTQCNLLAESICRIILRDNFTVILAIWASLQLTWVTMLLFVQLVQISRAKTTYENMRGHTNHNSPAMEAVTAALIAGTTSMGDAQLTDNDRGHETHGVHGHAHPRREGCFSQWKKLLGLDTFVATAHGGLAGSRRSQARTNPFSRGVVTNCRDFWCDPAPYFGQREVGAAMLDGNIVNYTRMYETPPRLKVHRPQQTGDEGMYRSLGEDDAV